jgi:tRNA(Ile)-lysidine synthase
MSPLLTQLLERCVFPDSASVCCAVSGGPDSLSLLALATASGRSVTAVHVDHGLRPGSAGDADVVAKAAHRFGAKFVAEKVNVEPGANLEARARAARYSVLPSGCLLGHTADDQAETILLNLMRGAGLSGLAGMDKARRPMLQLRRAETHALCRELDLEPVRDETNSSPQFRRNRVRAELLPLLDDIAERDVVEIVARQAELLQEDNRLLDSLAAELDPTDAKQIAAAPLPLAVRALRAWLRRSTDDELHPPSAAAVMRVLEVAKGNAVACEIEGGIRVSRRHQHLRVEADRPAAK